MERLEDRTLMAGDLRIVELNYNPHAALVQFGERDASTDSYEFIEVMNVGDASLDLAGYRITDGVSFDFAAQTLPAGGRLVVVNSMKSFPTRFGTGVPLALGNDGNGGTASQFGGNLSNNGERLKLKNPKGDTVQSFDYYAAGEWPQLANGQGSALEAIDPLGDFDDPKNWQATAEYGGSPGYAGTVIPGEVVVNEILTHTDLPQIDVVELANRTDHPVDMTGWYLTDSISNLFRFRISGPKSVIGAHQYFQFDEIELGFRFRGQEADNTFLVAADANGKPTRFVDAVSFTASQNGVSLGRWPDLQGELFPMKALTFGDPNVGPLIGDVVVSEIQYHPANPPEDFPLKESEMEFVELHNRTGTPLNIGEWRLRKSVNYTIPASTIIGAHSTLVVVSFDPVAEPTKAAAFRSFYGMPASAPALLGPYNDIADPNSDLLDNSGETIIWERPEDILQLGLGYVLVDRVTYKDDSGWPEAADGDGPSLTRTQLDNYGDFATSWSATIPTPGVIGLPGDANGDGFVNVEDVGLFCTAINLNSGESKYDLNRDQVVNEADMNYLITSVLKTTYGDANLDGVFNSSDLVIVFAAGEYEDTITRNSTWASGDWNCDFEFSTSDLVTAFQAGGYQAGASPASQTAVGTTVDGKSKTAEQFTAAGSPQLRRPKAVDAVLASLAIHRNDRSAYLPE